MVFLSHSSSARLVWCDPAVTAWFCLIRGHLVLHLDMDFCATQADPFLAFIELTPSLQNVFSHVLDLYPVDFQAYSTREARLSVVGSLRMELAELPDVQHMSQTTLDALTKPISEYYSCITPVTSAALQSYLPIRTAVLLSTLSITMSVLTFSLSFTLFRRRWQRRFKHPRKFFRVPSGRLIHIVESNQVGYEETDISFLYLTSDEFRALVVLARETMIQANAQPSNYTSSCAPSLPPRAYPDFASLQYAQTSTWNCLFLCFTHAFNFHHTVTHVILHFYLAYVLTQLRLLSSFCTCPYNLFQQHDWCSNTIFPNFCWCL